MHRNWSEICKLGHHNAEFMNFFVGTDPKSEFGNFLAGRFPECYSEQPISGPKPLSMFYDPELPRDSQWFKGAIAKREGVPLFCFSKNGREMTSYFGQKRKPLPSTVDPKAKVGDVVEWNDEQFLVVQTTGFGSYEWEFYIVPLAAVDPAV